MKQNRIDVDRRMKPRDSQKTGWDPYIFSLVSDEGKAAETTHVHGPDDSGKDAEEAPRHRSTIVRESRDDDADSE